MSTTADLEPIIESAIGYLQRLGRTPALPAALEISAPGVRLCVSLEFTVSATDADSPQAAQMLPRRPATECEENILSVLFETGHRLVTDQILGELEKREMLHGDCTVKTALARMASDGRLTKEPQGNPRGYGLPEWNATRTSIASQPASKPTPAPKPPQSRRPAADSPIANPSILDFQPSANGHAKQ
jgi:hypothetical protein